MSGAAAGNSEAKGAAPAANDNLLGEFVGFVERLMLGLTKIFPKCEKTALAYTELLGKTQHKNATIRDFAHTELIKKWHAEMSATADDKTLYDHCKAGDIGALTQLNVPVIKEIGLKVKIDNLRLSPTGPSKIAKLMEIVTEANTRAFMYNKLPSKVRDRVHDKATELQAFIDGGGNLAEIDIVSLGEQVLDGLSGSDMSTFMANMMDIQAEMGGSSAFQDMGIKVPSNLQGALAVSEGKMTPQQAVEAARPAVAAAAAAGAQPPRGPVWKAGR